MFINVNDLLILGIALILTFVTKMIINPNFN